MPKYYVESGWVRMILDARNAEQAARQIAPAFAAKGRLKSTPNRRRKSSVTRKPSSGSLPTDPGERNRLPWK